MIEIIPAIDLINGRCVRLSQGDFDTEKVYGDPLEMALRFEAAGLTRLHIVDLDGARSGKITNLAVLQNVAQHTKMKIDFSGGIRTTDDAQAVLNAGAAYISVGSIAVKQPELMMQWIQKFGAEKILLGADVAQEKVVVQGWQEQTELSVYELIARYYDAGLRQIFCTDIALDGMLGGPSIVLYQSIKKRFPELRLIASGGVSCMEDVTLLAAAGCSGVIIGKAIYEGNISLKQLTIRYEEDNQKSKIKNQK